MFKYFLWPLVLLLTACGTLFMDSEPEQQVITVATGFDSYGAPTRIENGNVSHMGDSDRLTLIQTIVNHYCTVYDGPQPVEPTLDSVLINGQPHKLNSDERILLVKGLISTYCPDMLVGV